ncbi:uncharacterized protein DNG_10215 [Cephalotrichum gorgonifer]|uniref:DUF8035 domain-containing protein n=1 Tax=Cephalotrichum gorgonifer TaxID=2041049 RepID=A0AAE8N772_9PEZI|nr:uncharacterized protein DNG_10215 [Cephalotrichum gorgonifer]
MADIRDRDHVYERDRSRADPYLPRRLYRSPSRSPSPDRLRYERRVPARFHDDLDSESSRSRRLDDYHPRRSVYHREDPRFSRPPPPLPRGRPVSPDYEPRREREPGGDYFRDRSPSPVVPRRPAALRRQSSLDTYDRPLGNDLHFLQREEYGPPARREDVLASYGAVPVEPRPRGVEFRDDESLVRGRPFPPPLRADHDRVREREIVRVSGRKSRDGESVTSRTISRTSGTGTSSDSSSDSSPSRATSVRSEYPKKGKTKIPGRLVSKRALIDLGYPFLDEGKTVIILKALGQDQIDQVLKVSEEYKKAELEVSAARSSSGNLVDDRRDEIYTIPPPPPPAAPTRDVEVVKETLVRNVSPSSRSYTTTSYPTGTSVSGSTYTGGGKLVLRPRSRSRSGREIRSEIKALEAELRAERRHRRRSRSGSLGRELVRVEKTADGQQIILSEERVEKVDEGYRGPRIERDRRGPPPALLRAMVKTLT